MDKIEKIRQEIERLKKYAEESKKEWINEGYTQNAFAEDCRITSFNRLLSFLDTLSEESDNDASLEASASYDTQKYTPSPSVDIGDVARVQFASHAKVFDKKRKAVFDWEQFKEVAGIFYAFGKKDSETKEKKQPDKSLEEEIQWYLREKCSGDDEPTVSEIARYFAKWQYQKERGEFAKIKAKTWCEGFDAHKEQMLKNAVEGEVESWRPVVGYTNYEVSSTGKVLSRKQLKDGVLLKQCKTWAGYKYVTLYDDNYIPHTCFVHRLVAEAFIPNSENKLTVNHKNENKEDNRVSNLEWATYNEQCAHGSMRGAITNFDMRSASDGEKKKFIRMRKYLRERGYIVDSTNLIAYWTNDTKRAIRMESEPIFFQYKQYSGEPIPKDNARNTPRKQVDRIDDNGNITKYNTISEAARDNHVSVGAIRRVLNGVNKTGRCNGYLFRLSKLKTEEE